jgi:hypothetical protein
MAIAHCFDTDPATLVLELGKSRIGIWARGISDVVLLASYGEKSQYNRDSHQVPRMLSANTCSCNESKRETDRN